MRLKKSKKVQGLEWAEMNWQRPCCIPAPKPKNAASKAGLAFERAVYKFLDNMFTDEWVEYNPWIKFKDAGGIQWCSPDIILFRHRKCAILIEVKLKATPLAEDTLKNLYLPLCEAVWTKDKFRTAQIVKHLPKDWKGPVIYSLDELLKSRRKFVTLVWSE